MKNYLPKNWSVKKSAEYCLRVTDGTHDTPKPIDEGKLLITSKNIKEGRVQLDGAYAISQNDFDEINRRSKVDQWDVLFSMIGTVGEIALVRNEPDYAIKNIGLFKNKSKIDGLWLYYYLTSSIGKAALDTYLTGTSQQFVSLGDLRKVPVIDPGETSKENVSAVLAAYDDLIENNRRRVTLLETMAEEIYREWFIRMRFPGHARVNKIKGVPEGWEIQKIGQLFNTSSGGTPSRENASNYDGDISWLKTGELKSTFVLDTEEKITQLGLENSSAKIYPRHTIVIAMYCAMPDISILALDSATNQACCAFFPKKDYLHYTYSYLLIKFAQKHLINFAHGAAQQNLSQELIKGFPLLTPTKDLIAKFSEIAEPIFLEVEKLMRAIVCLQRTRDALLPRLISGKLSVENLDIQFPRSMAEDAHA